MLKIIFSLLVMLTALNCARSESDHAQPIEKKATKEPSSPQSSQAAPSASKSSKTPTKQSLKSVIPTDIENINYLEFVNYAQKEWAPSQTKIPSKIETLSLKLWSETINTTGLKCVGSLCQEGVAALHLVHEEKKSKNGILSSSATSSAGFSCTGALIASNIVLTAAHCIPDNIFKDPNYSTASQIFIAFPEFEGKAAEVVTTSHLIGFSPRKFRDIPGTSLDFAFIQLSRHVDRKPLKISRSGIDNLEKYFILGVDTRLPKIDPWDFLISDLPCTATFHSVLLKGFDHKFDPVAAFGNCPLGPGNSGAPMVNADGQIVGVSQAQFSTKALRQINKMFNSMMEEGRINYIGQATNVACIPDFIDKTFKMPAQCAQDFEHAPGELPFSDFVQEQLNKKLELWSLSSGDVAWEIYRLPKSAFGNVFVPVPACITEQWLYNLETQSHQIRQLPIWEISIKGLGTYGALVMSNTLEQVNVLIDSSELYVHGKSKLQILMKDFVLAELPEVRWCSTR